MSQVARRILPARGEPDSSIRIRILDPGLQWRVRVCIISSLNICFLLLKIKIVPVAQNTEIMHSYLFIYLLDFRNSEILEEPGKEA